MDDNQAEQEWLIPAALDGERVDRALAVITGLSRREVNALVDDGRVTISGHPVVSRSRRVQSGERLGVDGPLVADVGPGLQPDADVEVSVVWVDDQVIVVDKPAGLVVHPGAGNRGGTLVHGLLARFPDLIDLAAIEGQQDRPGIVHRLDKGTSGLLVVARTDGARRSLIDQLASRRMGREYITLVAGQLESEAGVIDGPLGRSDADPTRIRVQAGGRPARTRYEVEARYENPAPTTLLRCRLETGRTHQIRVHLGSIGHPVIGDDRYGVTELTGWRPLPPGRPFLHAASITFEHPSSGESLHFSSPVPEDLIKVLAWIEPRG